MTILKPAFVKQRPKENLYLASLMKTSLVAFLLWSFCKILHKNSFYSNLVCLKHNVVRCAVCYHLYSLKNVANTHGCFLRLLDCTNGNKSCNASYM